MTQEQWIHLHRIVRVYVQWMDRPPTRWQNPSATSDLINNKDKKLCRAIQHVRTHIEGWVQYVSNQTLSGFWVTNQTLLGFQTHTSNESSIIHPILYQTTNTKHTETKANGILGGGAPVNKHLTRHNTKKALSWYKRYPSSSWFKQNPDQTNEQEPHETEKAKKPSHLRQIRSKSFGSESN